MKIKEGFVLRQVAGSYIVMRLGGENSLGGMITLNETGALIWKAIDSGKNVDEIAAEITKEYDIDRETAKNDIAVFIDKMKKESIIEDEV